MNPLDYFSADTNGAVSSPESRQEEHERLVKEWRDRWEERFARWERGFMSRNDVRQYEATKEQPGGSVAAAVICITLVAGAAIVVWSMI